MKLNCGKYMYFQKLKYICVQRNDTSGLIYIRTQFVIYWLRCELFKCDVLAGGQFNLDNVSIYTPGSYT